MRTPSGQNPSQPIKYDPETLLGLKNNNNEMPSSLTQLPAEIQNEILNVGKSKDNEKKTWRNR